MQREGNLPSRAPRMRVIVGGALATGVIDVRVMSTNYYSADWFHASFTYAGDQIPSLAYWSSVEGCEVNIQCRLQPQEEYRSLIEGWIDSVVIDPIHSIARIEGRDYSASLVGSCSRAAYANLSAGEIVSLVALNGGLTPDVYPTTDLIGRFYGGGNEQTLIGHYASNMTDWDLVVHLARREDYDVFVQGKSLYFGPRGGIIRRTFPIDCVDVTDLRLERCLERRRDLDVSIRSWNSQLQQAFGNDINSAAPSTALSAIDPDVNRGPATMVMAPNLRVNDIARMNRLIRQEIVQHRRTIELEMPGELDMTPRSRISLSGTRSEFDQDYDVESIDRLFGPASGYVQRVRARQSGGENTGVPISV